MDSDANTGHKFDLSEGIDVKTLLQVDASMVVGVLFILTLTAFISGSETTSRFLTGYFALLIVAPFVTSALLILYSKKVELAKELTAFGFGMFGGYLVLIMALQLIPTIPSLPLAEDVEQQCAKSPRTFNVSTDPWKCSKFSPGTLAERCVKNPEFFNVTKSDCVDFIPPSS